MLQPMFEIIMATIFSGIAIKLMDDALDQELDIACSRFNWAEVLGPGTVAYAAVSLAIAAAINSPISLTLFFASYSIGMFNNLRQVLPTKLCGWQESVIIILTGTIFFSWEYMAFSLLFIMAVQLFDDFVDCKSDIIAGQRNFAVKFGRTECALFCCILLLLALQVAGAAILLPVFAGTVLLYAIFILGEVYSNDY